MLYGLLVFFLVNEVLLSYQQRYFHCFGCVVWFHIDYERYMYFRLNKIFLSSTKYNFLSSYYMRFLCSGLLEIQTESILICTDNYNKNCLLTIARRRRKKKKLYLISIQYEAKYEAHWIEPAIGSILSA